jgi:hypothetical protein
LASLGQRMSLLIASRLDLGALTLKNKDVDALSSPLTNIFAEVPMSCFSLEDSFALLEKGKECFTTTDKELIFRVTGGHPFFLQVASYFLWDAYQDKTIPKTLYWNHICSQLYPYVANAPSQILIQHSKELKFLVGFFYFSGWRELYESLKDKNELTIKLLVGLDVDKSLGTVLEVAKDGRRSQQ